MKKTRYEFYNYGLNYLAGGLATYGMVKSGLDWKWYRLSVDSGWMGPAGYPGFYAHSAPARIPSEF